MSFHPFARNSQREQGSTFGWLRDRKKRAENFGALAHGDKADAALSFLGVKASAMIFNFEFESFWRKIHAQPGFAGAGVAADIIQRLLNDTVDVNTRRGFDRKRSSRL